MIGQIEKPDSMMEQNSDYQYLKNAKHEYNVDKMCDYAQESLGYKFYIYFIHLIETLN